jgi:DNA-binding MarR family transcriptional regulator
MAIQTLNDFYKEQENKAHETKSWWFRISKKRWFNEWKGLNTTQRSIMLSLHLYGGNKSICYPSMRTLSKDLKVNLKTIERNIKILQKMKFIKIEKKINQRGKYNEYTLYQ